MLIEKYLTEFRGSRSFRSDISTRGSISVHINSNAQGNGMLFDNWIDFNAGWTDDAWHHIAMTWQRSDGLVQVPPLNTTYISTPAPC